MNDLFQWEYQFFKPTSLFVIVGWGKTGSAHSSPLPKSFDLSIDQLVFRFYVTRSLYLNTYEWPIWKRESSFQTKHFICIGGERLGRPILPPSKMFWSFYLSFSLSVYVILLLYLKTYEWLIPKRWSNFQTKKFIGYPPPKCSNLCILS